MSCFYSVRGERKFIYILKKVKSIIIIGIEVRLEMSSREKRMDLIERRGRTMKNFNAGRQPKREPNFSVNVTKDTEKSSFSNLQRGAMRYVPVKGIKLWGSK